MDDARFAARFERRFWAKVEKTPSCWLWRGDVGRDGYGNVGRRGRHMRPHRLAYEFAGGTIPPGMTIDHLCRNPLCVRPAHLEVVTSRENTLRGRSPAARNARKTHCKYGHPLVEGNLVLGELPKRKCLTCDRRKGLWRHARNRLARAKATTREEAGAAE